MAAFECMTSNTNAEHGKITHYNGIFSGHTFEMSVPEADRIVKMHQ
jgi:hypothetical protein